jgi:O-antigen/teichoic acid export membrane protein
MQREFLINLLFLIFINLLIKPFYLFGIERSVQNTLSGGDYGLYFALFNLTFLFQIVNDLGIQYYNNQHVAKYRHLLSKYFADMLLLKLGLGLVFFLIVLVAGAAAGYRGVGYGLLALIAVNQMLNSFLQFLRSNISGLGLYRIDSLISVADKLALIVLLGIMLYGPSQGRGFTITRFVLMQTLSWSVAIGFCWLVLRGRIQIKRFRFKPALLVLILKQSYPFALAVFLMSAYNRLDGVMIERMLSDGKYQADIYASAYRLLEASNMIGFLFTGLLLPMFAQLYRDSEGLRQLVNFSFKLIFSVSVALAASVWCYRAEIMEALYHRGSTYSGDIMGLLMWSFIATCGGYVFGTLITASGRLGTINKVYAASLVLNIVLNILLIPTYKALGAAWAMLITQTAVFGAQFIIATRQAALQWPLSAWLRLPAFAGFSVVVAFLILFNLEAWWVVKFFVTICAIAFGSLLFRLVRLKETFRLLAPAASARRKE